MEPTAQITEASKVFDNLVQLSPPFLLALGINFMMLFLRRIPYMQSHDWLLPIFALVIGGIVYPYVAEVGKVSYNVKNPAVLLHIIGFAIGGLSVAFHQIFKQLMKKFFNIQTGDTMIMIKPPVAD